MPRYMLTHRHEQSECRFAFAAWRGFASPLRHAAAIASCATVNGDDRHHIWWTVEAPSAEDAKAMLPAYVGERTEVSAVAEVPIP